MPKPPVEPQERSVEVSGPTIDNRYPAAPLTFKVAGETCYAYSNGDSEDDSEVAGVPVTIRAIEIVDQVPPGPSVFQVTDVADLATCETQEDDALEIFGNCLEATLPTISKEQKLACALGIEFTGQVDHVAELRFSLEATCTDAEAPPCEDVQALSPTREAPVTVHWTTSGGEIEACPTKPPDEISRGSCSPSEDDG